MKEIKKKQLSEEEIETQKRKEEQHKLKMEALLKKKEEYKENLKRFNIYNMCINNIWCNIINNK